MISQIVAILLLLLGGERVPALVWLGRAAMWVVMGTALYSAVFYYREFLRLTPSGDRTAAPTREERG